MVDPRMLMAHQQAMMIAKQTYQLAVAQQAMRDAADECERGSAVSGWGGGGGRPSIAAPSVLGMGVNMNGTLGVGPFGMPPGAWPAGGGGSAARAMYAGGVYATCEIGVPSRGGTMGWSTTNSVYDGSFGASRAFRQGPGQQQHGPGGAAARESGVGTSGAAKWEGARQRTSTAATAPSSGGGQQQRPSAGAGGGARREEAVRRRLVGSPPSSWKGAQTADDVATVRPTGWHLENDGSGWHVTVDFTTRDEVHVTTHHIYYDARPRKSRKPATPSPPSSPSTSLPRRHVTVTPTDVPTVAFMTGAARVALVESLGGGSGILTGVVIGIPCRAPLSGDVRKPYEGGKI
ncbi:hypothetical protein EDB89DRAFT_2071834 [Lactarius sanguifluus]|nr:hypothetical protein EDB89DRAFT_2071834 [Lactarius sanguifluus]